MARRPDALFNPQFWAEDGAGWFSDAYIHHGIRPFLSPDSGYLQTSSCLVAWLAQAFPLTRSPLVFSLFAIAMQALPAVLLATHRFDDLVPDWRARSLLIGLYLLLPNIWHWCPPSSRSHVHRLPDLGRCSTLPSS